MKNLPTRALFLTPMAVLLPLLALSAQTERPKTAEFDWRAPARSEMVTPVPVELRDHKDAAASRSAAPRWKERVLVRDIDGLSAFEIATRRKGDADRQVAVGGGYVLALTRSGLLVYDKSGENVGGVRGRALKYGVDPRVCFQRQARAFVMDVWWHWGDSNFKNNNIMVSETDDPRGPWNSYAVSGPGGVIGGAVAASQRWTGHTLPGTERCDIWFPEPPKTPTVPETREVLDSTLVLSTPDMKAGQPTRAYHFDGLLGHPVLSQDPVDPLYFLRITDRHFIINMVEADGAGGPRWRQLGASLHGLELTGSLPDSPQKGIEQKTPSGSRHPKNVVLQGGFIWFANAIHHEGRAAVQWYQVRLDGSIFQRGLIASDTSSYIQPTLAVNERLDVLVSFQETSPEMFIGTRVAWRRGDDVPGTLRAIGATGEGEGVNRSKTPLDYSACCIDGDNGLDLWTIQGLTDPRHKGHTVVVRVPFADE
ncbi:hypothetical protein [Planctomycetes bacterium Poly30]